MIQKKFKVGYVRAKIIDQIETKEIISGYEGSKAGEILLKNNNVNNMENTKEDINVQVSDNIETKYIMKEIDEESIFEKWWFWVLTIIFVSIIIGNL